MITEKIKHYSINEIIDILKTRGYNATQEDILKIIQDKKLRENGMAYRDFKFWGDKNEVYSWKVSLLGVELIYYTIKENQKEKQNNLKQEKEYTTNELIETLREKYQIDISKISKIIKNRKLEKNGFAKKMHKDGKYKWIISEKGRAIIINNLCLKSPKIECKLDFKKLGIKYDLNDVRKEYIVDNTTLRIALKELEEHKEAFKGPKSNGVFMPDNQRGYKWFLNEEGFNSLENWFEKRNNMTKNKQLIIREIQDKQKPITYNENVYSIVLDNENAGFLHIISSSLNKNEIEVIKNVVEKFIDSKKEQIAKIFLGATNNE